MHFAVLGKNPEISLRELELVHPSDLNFPKKGIVTFSCTQPEYLSQLGGCIKSGRVVAERDLPEILKDVKIIGIKEIANGKHLKKTMGIRRFKTVDIFHTDKEIKEKGQELINLGNGDYGIVEQRQNIELYETIDFDKPGRSMQMGMMPSKLVHIMLNIWVHELGKDDPIIYDPFVGSGTTAFLANALGYDSLGSDINTKYADQNIDRWKTSKRYHQDKSIEFFTQDITGSLDISDYSDRDILIISEWRLGPIITEKSNTREIQDAERAVQQVYTAMLHTCSSIQKQTKSFVGVVTIPRYTWGENRLEKILQQEGTKIGLAIEGISEVYKREKQKVGRKILIIK